MRVRRLVLPLAVLIGAALAPAASHAAVTIGPNPLQPGTSNVGGCAGVACTYTQSQGGAPTPTSPMNGVIVRWRINAGSGSGDVKLRVLRPGAGGAYTAVGTGTPRTVAATAGLQTFENEHLKIAQGDTIGIDNASNGLYFTAGAATDVVRYFNPLIVDNAAARMPTGTQPSLVLQVNADVEPDLDGDGFGDQTQDACPADPTRQTTPCGTGPANPLVPVVSGLRATPASIRFGSRSSIRFRISKQATWTLRFYQRRSGRKRGSRCVLNRRSGRRCTIYTYRGRVTGTGGPGQVTVVFRGAVANRRSLPTGVYRITATARDSIGTSTPVNTTLTLRPKLRHR